MWGSLNWKVTPLHCLADGSVHFSTFLLANSSLFGYLYNKHTINNKTPSSVTAVLYQHRQQCSKYDTKQQSFFFRAKVIRIFNSDPSNFERRFFWLCLIAMSRLSAGLSWISSVSCWLFRVVPCETPSHCACLTACRSLSIPTPVTTSYKSN